MSRDDKLEPQCRLCGPLFQAIGLSDVALGIGIALYLPDFIGRDPTTDLMVWIGSGIIVPSGVVMWWWGWRLGTDGFKPRSGPAVRRNR